MKIWLFLALQDVFLSDKKGLARRGGSGCIRTTGFATHPFLA
jgi:hypothetical protein